MKHYLDRFEEADEIFACSMAKKTEPVPPFRHEDEIFACSMAKKTEPIPAFR